jgi:hypothetical protein
MTPLEAWHMTLASCKTMLAVLCVCSVKKKRTPTKFQWSMQSQLVYRPIFSI